MEKGENSMKKISVGTLILSLLVPLLVGGTSAALSATGMVMYGNMNKPPLSPPVWVFSVAWTILYFMMGLASYYIIVSEAETYSKAMALIVYAIQLVMNFMWSIMFFNWGSFLAAFIWLIIMWVIVILCAIRFYRISRKATYLLFPYIVWLGFAAYLNMGAYVLNTNI